MARYGLTLISYFSLGVYITKPDGEVLDHIRIEGSSASSLAIDQESSRLLVSVMHAKGRNIHIFDLNDFSRNKVSVFVTEKAFLFFFRFYIQR